MMGERHLVGGSTVFIPQVALAGGGVEDGEPDCLHNIRILGDLSYANGCMNPQAPLP